MSDNKLYIAAAGAGKTTFLVNHAIELLKGDDDRSIAIITYTQKNQEVIKERIKEDIGCVPSRLRICGWYDFLLSYCIRPFMGSVIEDLRCKNVGFVLINGVSGKVKTNNGSYLSTYKADDLKKKFLTDDYKIYSDKLSEFAYKCYEARKAQFVARMNNVFSDILIDEVQDLSAWDYEIVKALLKMGELHVVMCGDLRQKTYSTTDSSKWGKYKGRIDEYLKKEVNTKRFIYVDIDYSTLNYSHRFGREIADFASLIMGKTFPKTEPCKCADCNKRQEMFKGKTGVYLIRRSDMLVFVERFKPLVLVWNKSHEAAVRLRKYNYGESKGMSTDVCMIFPTNEVTSFLKTPTHKLKELARNKLYVAATRARFITSFIVEDDFDNSHINLPFWESESEEINC